MLPARSRSLVLTAMAAASLAGCGRWTHHHGGSDVEPPPSGPGQPPPSGPGEPPPSGPGQPPPPPGGEPTLSQVDHAQQFAVTSGFWANVVDFAPVGGGQFLVHDLTQGKADDPVTMRAWVGTSPDQSPKELFSSHDPAKRLGAVAGSTNGKTVYAVETKGEDSYTFKLELHLGDSTVAEFKHPFADSDPVYDANGQVVDHVADDKRLSRVFQIASADAVPCEPERLYQFPDGDVALLVLNTNSVSLVRYGADGKVKAAKRLIPRTSVGDRSCFLDAALTGDPKTGELAVAAQVQKVEWAGVKATLGASVPAYPGGGTGDGVAVLFRLAPDLTLKGFVPVVQSGVDLVLKDVSLAGGKLAATGTVQTPDRKREVAFATVDGTKATVHTYALSQTMDDGFALAPLAEGRYVLGGETGYQQVPTGSVTQAGDGFYLVVDGQGKELARKTFGKDKRDVVTHLRDGGDGNVYASIGLDQPLTHTEADQATGSAGVYKLSFK